MKEGNPGPQNISFQGK